MDSDNTSGAGQMDIQMQILHELKQLNGRVAKVEETVENQEKEQLNSPRSSKSGLTTASTSQDDADLVLPSLTSLKNSYKARWIGDCRNYKPSICKASSSHKGGDLVKLCIVKGKFHGHTTLYSRVRVDLEFRMIACLCPNGYQVSVQLFENSQM